MPAAAHGDCTPSPVNELQFLIFFKEFVKGLSPKFTTAETAGLVAYRF